MTFVAVVWLLLLLNRILSTPVLSAPTNGFGQPLQKQFPKLPGGGIKTSKAKERFDRASIKTRTEENSLPKKKTSISVNGKVLPLAALSATDKNIHVTLQQSPHDNQQGAPLQPGQAVGSPQALVQEIAPGTPNSQVNLQGNEEPLRSPTNLQIQQVSNSLSSEPQAPGTFRSPNLSPSSLNAGQDLQQPLRSPTNIPLEEWRTQNSLSSEPEAPGTFRSPPLLNSPSSSNTAQEQQPLRSPTNVPQAPGMFHSPPLLNSPSSLNAGQEQQPFDSPPNIPQAPGLFRSPTLTNVQGQPLGTLNSPQNLQGQSLLSSNSQGVSQGALDNQKIACNTPLNNQNPQTATTLMNLGQNSEGQLTYKPLRC